MEPSVASKPPVLLITRDFPPHCRQVGWMVRAASLANHLSRKGRRVLVLATGRARAWPELYRVDPAVRVSWIRSIPEYYNVPRPDSRGRALWFRLLRSAMGRLLRNRVVDISQLDRTAYVRRASRIIRHHGIRDVIVSTPPHSLQLVGMDLKQRFGADIRLIVDLRDPWTLRRKYRGTGKARAARLHALEQRVLMTADQLVLVSDGMRRMYQRRFQLPKVVSVVENGYLPVAPVRPAPDFLAIARRARDENRVLIGYFGVGGLDSERRDGKYFGPLVGVLAARPDIARRVYLVAQGDFRAAPDAVADPLRFAALAPASYHQARSHMSRVDAGLVLYTDPDDAPLVMGGKIYDYIGSGCPLLFLVPANAESIRALVEKTGKPLIADIHSSVEVESVLEQLIAEYDADRLSSRGFDEQERTLYSREAQYDKLLDLLDREPS